MENWQSYRQVGSRGSQALCRNALYNMTIIFVFFVFFPWHQRQFLSLHSFYFLKPREMKPPTLKCNHYVKEEIAYEFYSVKIE